MRQRTFDRKVAKLHTDLDLIQARSRKRKARGLPWHWPVTRPFVLTYDLLDLKVVRWRRKRLERLTKPRGD